ncbi:aspartate carbamoyltransferase [Legionella beliardensis]|uniref:Aspartate carbamoyltransferase n=1 Tax=Legionella beliardensis TaxID=91822 RepID=A0A378HZF3_9GAMM|nr:aspartate carbamoyltransferase catalytic subunit [Legionella beliardensis]STX28132.1 aspartate carbamoyltransferase [Legionella beliardensis]
MNHFLEISQLTTSHIERLLKRAMLFKQTGNYPNFSSYKLANLFYENSTRTRVSFELAANHLSIYSVNLALAASSEAKGEIIEDTIHTLAAMGIDLFVIRHKQEGIQQHLAEHINSNIHIINAGDGKHAHPSQAMLDLMTIMEYKPNLEQLKIAIVGDLRHSRVANSLQCLFALMSVKELVLVAPSMWQPSQVHYGRVTNSLKDGLAEADVVICLRIQNERLTEDESIDLDVYRANYAITSQALCNAKNDVMVMHPGPINRGVEIESDVADGPHSAILHQVANGVFMRMAIIESLLI